MLFEKARWDLQTVITIFQGVSPSSDGDAAEPVRASRYVGERVKRVVHDDSATLNAQYAHLTQRPVTAFTVLGFRAHARDYLAAGTSLRPSQTS